MRFMLPLIGLTVSTEMYTLPTLANHWPALPSV